MLRIRTEPLALGAILRAGKGDDLCIWEYVQKF